MLVTRWSIECEILWYGALVRYIWATTLTFQQCGILTSAASFSAKKLRMLFSQQLNSHRIFKRLAKALIRLRLCAGWSEALLLAHTTLFEISCRGSFGDECSVLTPVSSAWDMYIFCVLSFSPLLVNTHASALLYLSWQLNVLWFHNFEIGSPLDQTLETVVVQ